MHKALLSNITWNPYGWSQLYSDSRAGASFPQDLPGHESLNFKFDKEGIDTNNHIFGYSQWTNNPVNLIPGGIIFFYSKNLVDGNTYIVGIYGGVEILKPIKEVSWMGFENNLFLSNIRAFRSISVLFPKPLLKKHYVQSSVTRIGFKYIEDNTALRIITDELFELLGADSYNEECLKLKELYNYISGQEDVFDLIEQEEIEKHVDTNRLDKIINDLSNLKAKDPIKVEFNGRAYKRDNKTVVQLKILRNYKCQICQHNIPTKEGKFYIEAAHIRPKKDQGNELPSNILILCPNHHKEFDYGKKQIIKQSSEVLEIVLNGKEYVIDQRLKS